MRKRRLAGIWTMKCRSEAHTEAERLWERITARKNRSGVQALRLRLYQARHKALKDELHANREATLAASKKQP